MAEQHNTRSTLQMHSVSLSFHLRLSLSVNGQMAIKPYTRHLNYHSAIHTQSINIFYFEMCGQRWVNFLTAKWQFSHRQVIWPFTLELKRKRNLRHSNTPLQKVQDIFELFFPRLTVNSDRCFSHEFLRLCQKRQIKTF